MGAALDTPSLRQRARDRQRHITAHEPRVVDPAVYKDLLRCISAQRDRRLRVLDDGGIFLIDQLSSVPDRQSADGDGVDQLQRYPAIRPDEHAVVEIGVEREAYFDLIARRQDMLFGEGNPAGKD